MAIRLPLWLSCCALLTASAAAQSSGHGSGTSGAGAGPGAAGGAACPDEDASAQSHEIAAAMLPPSYVDETLVSGLDQAVGIVFAPDGTLLAWRRSGVVQVLQDGVLVNPPVIDLSEEVGAWGDHGLQGVALDPDFAVNGRIYLSYVVDFHYLTAAGLPGYVPATEETYRETIGRITRYTVHGSPPVADPASRFVLLGEDIHHGFPICSASHGLGSLAFGSDGTLLAACGDGNGGAPATGTALSDGIITPHEDVDNFRAQLVDSLAGKIVRISAETGDGVPSNPFFDPLAPRAPRSRVWTLGLRNPFRFTVRPGTGSASPASGDPGALYIGDVGGSQQEEISVVTSGGANLGWPIWEGLALQPDLGTAPTANLDAPNPLFGLAVPGGGTCTQQYFDFHDLLVPDSLHPLAAPNPCDPSQLISSAPVFRHQPPAIAWTHHGIATSTPVYDAAGNGTAISIGVPGSPVTGEPFGGGCSVGGAFLAGSAFPPELQGCYFHADFGAAWIRAFRFDATDRPVAALPFAESSGPVVAIAASPTDGALYYINYGNGGVSAVHRIRYTTSNLAPHAVIAAKHSYGAAPLIVALDGGGSTDPENGELHYHWDFGDGTPPSAERQPVHVYPSEDITAKGTIIARLFELSPPVPNGKGNPNAEVIRDGDQPPLDCSDTQRQWDTYHVKPSGPDKGLFDWVGYSFSQPHAFHAILFQEGMHFSGWGGWWLAFVVQVRQNGAWNNVEPVLVQPPYPGALVPYYETFEMHFLPMTGDAIRILGVPAGSAKFFSVGELRVMAEPAAMPGTPQLFPIALTVTDNAGNSDSTTLSVGVNDTPPHATIASPRNYSSYPVAAPKKIHLRSKVSDAESSNSLLTCAWQVIDHHNTHTHPGPVINQCQASAVLGNEGGDGDLHYIEVKLTVTDPTGLTGTRSHYLVPSNDRNLNGLPDAGDIAAGVSLDHDHDGLPDELETDCNGNGAPDFYDIFFGTSTDANGNGLPDDCEPASAAQPH